MPLKKLCVLLIKKNQDTRSSYFPYGYTNKQQNTYSHSEFKYKVKPDFFDTSKAVNHPDFKSSPFIIKEGLKATWRRGRWICLMMVLTSKQIKPKPFPWEQGKNLKDIHEISREESWYYREQSLNFQRQITLPNETKLL